MAADRLTLVGTRVSAAVLRLFDRGELRGTVVSAHRAALNLVCAGRLVTCSLPELGALPNGITVAGPDDLRSIATTGADVIVDGSSARVWSPVLPPFVETPSLQAVAQAASAAAGAAPAGGFGPLLRSLDDEDGDLFRAAARPALRALLAAAQRGDRGAAERAAASLVGLGSGLTPSGDDVLVGFTAALTAARAVLARPIARAAAAAGGRTTLIARTYLDHAARGEYAERVHDLTAAVAAGAEAQVVRGMSWGATSGADLALGILLGARAAWMTRETRAA